MKTYISKLPVGIAALTLFAINNPIAHAQREAPTREERREQRQERTENMTPEERQKYRQERMEERLKSMTPEQRAQWEERRTQIEQMQRQAQIAAVSSDDRQKFLMQSAGINDVAEQDAILTYVAELAQHRQLVTDAATGLSTLLGDANAAPAALSTQLAKLQTASKDFRIWQEGALKELDAKVNYTTNPRLQSLLTLVGILGDESQDAGGFNAIFPKGVAGTGDIVDLLPKTENNDGWGGMGGGRGGNGRGMGSGPDAPPADAPAPPN